MKKNNIIALNIFLSLIFLSVTVSGYFYRVNLMEIEINSVGGHVLDKRQITQVKNQKGKTLPGIDKALLANPTEELLLRGKKLFDVNCFSCHGLKGEGDGVAAVALNPKPRNFHIAEGWKNGHKVADIFRTLSHGLITTGMPGFDYMPPRDRLALTHYVRSFNPGLPKDSPTELKKLDGEFALTKGTIEPNTIPVEKAEELLVRENMPTVERTRRAAELMKTADSEEAKIFAAYVTDREKVAAVLFNSSAWEKSVNDFKQMVTADPFVNGFTSGILRAGPVEMQKMYAFARRLKKRS